MTKPQQPMRINLSSHPENKIRVLNSGPNVESVKQATLPDTKQLLHKGLKWVISQLWREALKKKNGIWHKGVVCLIKTLTALRKFTIRKNNQCMRCYQRKKPPLRLTTHAPFTGQRPDMEPLWLMDTRPTSYLWYRHLCLSRWQLMPKTLCRRKQKMHRTEPIKITG